MRDSDEKFSLACLRRRKSRMRELLWLDAVEEEEVDSEEEEGGGGGRRS